MKTSVLIRNARLTDGSAPADLLVSGGVITAKAPAGTLLESAAEKALDAFGKLVLPACLTSMPICASPAGRTRNVWLRLPPPPCMEE